MLRFQSKVYPELCCSHILLILILVAAGIEVEVFLHQDLRLDLHHLTSLISIVVDFYLDFRAVSAQQSHLLRVLFALLAQKWLEQARQTVDGESCLSTEMHQTV